MRRVFVVALLLSACEDAPPTAQDPGFVEHTVLGVEKLYLRPGFQIAQWAIVAGGMRNIIAAPNGDVYVGTVIYGQVLRLRDTDSNGTADATDTVATGLLRPFGLALRGDTLYIAEEHRVSRLILGTTSLSTVVPSLPNGAGHTTRTIVFGPDNRLYLSVGSSCNVCLESDTMRAAVLQFNPDGSGGRVFARGLRNSVGLAFHPTTGELWATNNDRDDLGGNDYSITDTLPPERINIARATRWYGWPQCYLPNRPNPEFQNANCALVEPPAITFQAHSAPLGIAFYTGTMFPPEYQGDAFVAFHGSWNRTQPTGAKVVRVQVQGGRPVAIDDFAFGWQRPNGSRWGRPVAVVSAPDGSLLISDDGSPRIWRITYAPAP